MDGESLHEIVKRAETNYVHGTSRLGEHVDFEMHATVEKIFAYLNSRHTTGSQDSLGRDKPFFNIVTAAVNIWYRATDLDRKDMIILPDKNGNVIPAFFATVLLQDWMKRNKFNVFLNHWGRTLAQYGSAVVKFVEQDGELKCSVVPWSRLIVDPVNFDALPRIEKFYKTPAQLMNMATKGHPDYAGYDMEKVKSLIENRGTRKNLNQEQVDNQAEFIELYEVHGLLSMATYNEAKGLKVSDADKTSFRQQMHVITWQEGKDGKDIDYTLFSGKEKQDPYMITHLIEEEGRTLAIGAVEYLFDAQWMTNHTMKAWKDQMDLASKLVFQTADTNFVGRNVLTNIENGDILIHSSGNPLTLMPNTGHDITNLKAFADQWRVMAQEITSTPDAVRGNTLPSGTPYSLGAYLGTQSLSLFEIMTENKGNSVEEMLRRFIIPNIKSKLNTKEEIIAIMEDRDIKRLDAMYIPREAARRYNSKVKKEFLNGLPNGVPSPYMPQVAESEVAGELSSMGNMRPLGPGDVTWAEALKDLEWKLDVGITNEQADKQAVFQTLTSVLQTLATNPGVLQDPNMKLLFGKILTMTNTVSPVELSAMPAPVATQPQPNQLPLEQLAANNKNVNG